MNLRLEVAKQLNFIVSSCRLYDEGRHEEAVRIALAARVLFHETPNSQSLIHGCFKITDIKLRSTTMLNMPVSSQSHSLGFLGLELSTGNFRPMLDTTKRNVPTPFVEWWEEPVLKLNNKEGEMVTRKQIILFAANRDGGAHVEENKPIWYECLTVGLGIRAIVKTRTGQKLGVIFQNANLAALRQIGHELLISEELTVLAQR
jgi:hypothetical protein